MSAQSTLAIGALSGLLLLSGCEAGTSAATSTQGAPVPAPSQAPPEESADPAVANGTEGCTREGALEVSTADELSEALEDVSPGETIYLNPGTYLGRFEATVSGTAAEPITLCGSREAVLEGGGPKSEETKGMGDSPYALHLEEVSYWKVSGFTIQDAQKGLMASSTNHSTFSDLLVQDTGDEAIHLRTHSSDNLIENNEITRTGLRKPKFGEGIYIGSAESNWEEYTQGQPDLSDRNTIRGNTITETTAEAIDIKEGTTGGLIENNTFEGSSLSGADSWVDVKGNNWRITGNEGTNSPEDGYQVHDVVDGWGRDNVFENNKATVNGSGYGYYAETKNGNIVACNNEATGAAAGFSYKPCE